MPSEPERNDQRKLHLFTGVPIPSAILPSKFEWCVNTGPIAYSVTRFRLCLHVFAWGHGILRSWTNSRLRSTLESQGVRAIQVAQTTNVFNPFLLHCLRTRNAWFSLPHCTLTRRSSLQLLSVHCSTSFGVPLYSLELKRVWNGM